MEERSIRRSIIIVLYVVIFLGISWFLYWVFKDKATCFDAIQNQGEEGVDCGKVCSNQCLRSITTDPLVVKETALVYGGRGTTDVLVAVRNPNDEAGASSFRYRVEITSPEGKKEVREGKSFILPQETKYLMEIGVALPETSVATVSFSDYVWERFSGYQEKPPFVVLNRRYEAISSGTGFGKAFGIVRNDSLFDFRTVTIKVVLRDEGGKAIGLNKTEQRTMTSGETREFQLIWPTSFPGVVSRVETEIEADVFRSDNFLKQYLPAREFQSY